MVRAPVSTVQSDALKPNDVFIGKVVARYLAPSVLSMIGTRVSSLANGLILGNLIGEKGLGALSIVTPVALVYLSLGALIGVGASIVSGIALGRGDRDACDRIYTLSYAVSLLTGLVLMIAGLAAAGEIAAALGAEGEVFPLARDYIRVAAVGGVFTILLYTPLNYLRLCGKPGRAMVLLLIMSFASMGFSAFFVAALGMRAEGVALGGGVGSLAACLFGLYCLSGARSQLRVRRLRVTADDLRAMLGAGGAPSLGNICRSAQYACMNLLFMRVAPWILPAYAVVCTVQDIFLAVILGFSQILLPLVSFSYGERDGRCVRAVTKRILLVGSLSVFVCAALLLSFRGRVGALFGIRDEAVLDALRTALLFVAFSVNISFINNIACSYFNITRRAALAVMTTLCRLLIFTLLPAYALADGMGAQAVWVAMLFSECLTAATLAAALRLIRARDKSLSRFWLLDDSFAERRNIIDFSVANTNEAAASASARIVDFCEANAVPL
jgi:Na+-driven multidrug efflux pump